MNYLSDPLNLINYLPDPLNSFPYLNADAEARRDPDSLTEPEFLPGTTQLELPPGSISDLEERRRHPRDRQKS